MSFDSRSELPPHLLALANLTQWHANRASQPLSLRFTVDGAKVGAINVNITGAFAEQPPADYTRAVTVAVYEIAQNGHFKGTFDVRINTVPGGQTIIKQIPVAPASGGKSEEVPPAKTAAPISHNGMQLRSALLARGHSSGYSADEIAAEEKRRGFTFTPELKFYRTLVREGIVAERDGVRVLASAVQADFGAATIDSAPWRAPETTDGTVQAVLTHNLWVEIANDSEHLYAIDLAPGAAGHPGQIIARRRGEASVPVRIALSLAQFVAGDFTDERHPAPAGDGSQAAAPQPKTGQTLAWAGSIEPLALPGFLGWTLAPNQKRYAAVMQVIDPEKTADAAEAAEATATADRGVTAPEQEAELSGYLAQDLHPAPAPPATAVPPATEVKSAALFTAAEAEPKTVATEQVGAPVLTVSDIEQAPGGEVAEVATADDTGQGTELDHAVEAHISREQQEIASSIAALAFGSKEERSEFVASDTGTVPAPVHQPEPENTAVGREDRQKGEPGALRSALRRFFLG